MTWDKGSPGGPEARPDDAAALDAIEGELRELAARTDPVPPEVLTATRSLLGLRALDAELAVLLLDSWDPDAAQSFATIRSGDEPRVLSYGLRGVTIDLEVTPGSRGCDVVGHVGPIRPDALQLEAADGRTPAEADALGRFLAHVAPGPFRLRARFGDRQVATPWVSV